mgnify:FL=1
MNTSEKLQALRRLMQEINAHALYVGTTDPHQTESVSEHWKAVQWLTGFTGSMGYAVVTQDEAAFWTDGRYIDQARREIEPQTFQLYSISDPDTPLWNEWIRLRVHEGEALSVDGEVLSQFQLQTFREKLTIKNLQILCDRNLVGEVWTDRPQLSQDPVWELPQQYAVQSRQEKLLALRKRLQKFGNKTSTLICGLDDIAWLTNLRGHDNALYPFFHSYALVTPDEAFLCADRLKFSESILKKLSQDGWSLQEYGDIERLIQQLPSGTTLYLDETKTPFKLYSAIPKNVTVKTGLDEVTAMKACKSRGEQDNIRRANIEEAVAVVRLMRWIESNVQSGLLNEYEVGQKLNEFRQASSLYIQPANIPIVGYGANAALPHYRPTRQNSASIQPEGLLLFDVCAHYFCGTTDLTRTVAVGELTREMKEDYTLTLKTHVALATLTFPYGTTGDLIDAVVKSNHWRKLKNYNHGTGHGIGYILNVHEGPGKIITEYAPLFPYAKNVVLEKGMLFSDEPGVYKPGRHGVRIENSVLVQKAQKNEFGKFMRFETVTFLPYERKAILTDELTEQEVDWINRYHEEVFRKLSPMLNEQEKCWLKEKTAPL